MTTVCGLLVIEVPPNVSAVNLTDSVDEIASEIAVLLAPTLAPAAIVVVVWTAPPIGLAHPSDVNFNGVATADTEAPEKPLGSVVLLNVKLA